MDLHILAATALESAQQGPRAKLSWASRGADAYSRDLSEQSADMDYEAGGEEAHRRPARSSDGPRAGVQKGVKHRAAEAKRRERINERLQALRELVPHDTRSNTATFLEGVISYIQSLQQNNTQLETELSNLRALRAAAAANLQQQQDLLAQPAGSESNPAHSSHQPGTHQQMQHYASSWRQDSITGPMPHSPEAAAAAAAAAAVHWQQAASAAGGGGHPDSAEAAATMQVLQHHLQQQQVAGAPSAERQALSSSPPLHHAEALAASTLSAPAALMQGQRHPAPAADSSGAAAAAAAAAAGMPVAAGAAAAAGGGGVQPQAADGGGCGDAVPAATAPLQASELQGVLEKALLAALQQQAQQLATQLLSRGS